MRSFLRFQLKRLPWRLIALAFGLLFVLIYFSGRFDITTFPNQPTSISRSIRYMDKQLDLPIREYSPNTDKTESSNVPKDQRDFSEMNYRKIKNALHQKKYRLVNLLILYQLQKAPRDYYPGIILSAGFNDMWINTWESSTTVQEKEHVDLNIPYEYLVTQRLNVTPLVSDRSDALNVVANVLGIHRWNDWLQSNNTLLVRVFLALMCILFGLVFTREYSHQSDDFTRTLPISMFRYQAARAFLTILVFDLVVLSVVILNIVIFTLTPDHDLGSLLYPIVFMNKGDTIFVVLWQFYGLWFLLINLWAFFLAGLSLLFSFWIKGSVTNIFCLGVIAFAKPLNLLALFPKEVQPFLPANYDAFSDMFYRLDLFDTLPPSKWIAIFAAWIVLVWIAVALIIKIRERPKLFVSHAN
ncbi:ABC transporter permease [Schleiferilactobacillus perolens]|uniref:ABC transporter permease n=1 Tax=Schleiferilactobacillus perolens TaxID=100468 RepID=UPI000709E9FA|nr:ABC transporter permease [Schleiferilactobacillus perolens]